MISWFHYVRHADVLAFEKQGWIVASDLGPVHGQWSVLMKWAGEGNPPNVGE